MEKFEIKTKSQAKQINTLYMHVHKTCENNLLCMDTNIQYTLLGHVQVHALLEYYWDTIRILLGHYENAIGTVLGYYWDIIRILLGYYWDIIRMILG